MHQHLIIQKDFLDEEVNFSLSSQFLSARWNSAKLDNRGSFYASSSMAPATDNLNTLYMYNFLRGRLTNVPDLNDDEEMFVGLYEETTASVRTYFTASRDSTGIYSASVYLNTTASYVYDIWSTGSYTTPSATQFFTGTVAVKTFAASENNPDPTYVTSLTNLKTQIFYR